MYVIRLAGHNLIRATPSNGGRTAHAHNEQRAPLHGGRLDSTVSTSLDWCMLCITLCSWDRDIWHPYCGDHMRMIGKLHLVHTELRHSFRI